MPEQPGQHGERMLRDGLVDIRLLKLQGLAALHAGRGSRASSDAFVICGNSSSAHGSRVERPLRSRLSGSPSTNCPLEALFPVSSHYPSDLERMFDLNMWCV
jgi:hypothetical protein